MGLEALPMIMQGGQTLAGMVSGGSSGLASGLAQLGQMGLGQMMQQGQDQSGDAFAQQIPPVQPENKQYSFIGGKP